MSKFRNRAECSRSTLGERVAVASLLLAASLTVLAVPTQAAYRSASAKLFSASGQSVGMVTFTTQREGSVNVRVRVQDLPPGFHGFHIHSVGQCTPPFTSAGGHLAYAGQTHNDHAGDLPVLLVTADGTAEARFTTDRFALDQLFDADGSALIIHANRDNLANIPTDRYDPDPDSITLATGDAGGRIACGVIESARGRGLNPGNND